MRQMERELKEYLERAQALRGAMALFEWDNETLAPKEAGELTARMIGSLSGEYFRILTSPRAERLARECREEELSPEEAAQVRELKEEMARIKPIPEEEYEENARLTARAGALWARAKENEDFDSFAPVLKEVIGWQKRFAALRAREGQRLYDVMLEDYEKGFDMESLDLFFGLLKRELVPFLRTAAERGRQIDSSFLTGDFPEEKQEELARFMAGYVGFDFRRGVLAASAHPFTTSLHNRDVRLTTHYSRRLDSSLFSVLHEAGHGIYEQGIGDGLTMTLAGQGAGMGMHESQSRFFENIIGRSHAFWEPVYGRLQELFPRELGAVSLERFILAVNRVEPGPVRTEADELSYSIHVMIRYELEKRLIEEDMEAGELPGAWGELYEKYLGVRPERPSQGVLQDIHWSQGSFGYFPSYALGSAMGAQIYFAMRERMDFDGLLRQGRLGEIRDFLRERIHRYGRMKTSRQILRETTGEDFNPAYYIRYLKEKYGALCGIEDKNG